MTPETFRATAVTAGLITMLIVETFFAARNWQTLRRKRFIFHASLMIFNTAILHVPAYLPLIAWHKYIIANNLSLLSRINASPAVNILATLIIFDMLNYWWHRLSHRVPFLWRFHKVHHVDTHVDVTTSLRFHPGELLISTGVKTIWLIAIGPSIWAFAIFQSAITAAAQFHHTNIDLPDRTENITRKIFVTPRYHTAHHTVNKRTGNNNFATIFICWDKIFGTYRQPDYEEMKTLGLPKGRDTYLSIKQTITAPFTKEY